MNCENYTVNYVDKLCAVVEAAKKVAECQNPSYDRESYPKKYDNCGQCSGCALLEALAALKENE